MLYEVITTSGTFAFLLPQSGTYKVKTRVMKKGFVLTFGQTRLTADGGDQLVDRDCGEVTLSAGRQQMTIDVPSRGGIDFVDLERADDFVESEPIAEDISYNFV